MTDQPAAPTRTLPAHTLPTFTPVPRQRIRRGGWSAARQREFIAWLARTGSVRAACRQIGMTEHGAYDLRRHPEGASFAAAWEAALDIGIQRLEDVAMDRALNGVEEAVFHKGEQVGTRRVYNDRLLMFLLKHRAPQRFAADAPRPMGIMDRALLARLKKQWRAEWDQERALLAAEEEADILASLNAKIDAMRQREDAARSLLLEDWHEAEEDALAEDPPARPPAAVANEPAAPQETASGRVCFNLKGERWVE